MVHLDSEAALISDFLGLVLWLVRAYVWALILAALFSMLASYGVIDTRNRLVRAIGDFLYGITEPVLRPLRRILPLMGGFDLSPLVAILVLQFLVAPLIVRIDVALADGNWAHLAF